MRLKPAKSVPEFRTIEEEAQWWDTHDTSELWKKGKPVRPLKLPPDQVKFIQERAAARKQAISIRLDKRTNRSRQAHCRPQVHRLPDPTPNVDR